MDIQLLSVLAFVAVAFGCIFLFGRFWSELLRHVDERNRWLALLAMAVSTMAVAVGLIAWLRYL